MNKSNDPLGVFLVMHVYSLWESPVQTFIFLEEQNNLH